MSFTPDELQAFNDILEKKLSVHRREMEGVFDQRLRTLRREVDQRLLAVQQDIMHTLTQKLSEQQQHFQASLQQKLTTQQMNIIQAMSQEVRQRHQQQQPQLENIVDRALAAQLLAIQEMLDQQFSLQPEEDGVLPMSEHAQQFETIEVQTDLPWEDLIDIFGKVLDERFTPLHDSTQSAMRNLEQYFVVQMRSMQTQLQNIASHNRQSQTHSGNITNMQEVFQSIEQLGSIIESMQVAMTANHALLSNRLYHHQQLSLERAHGNNPTPPARLAHPNGTNANSPLSLNGERGDQ
jgi:hypothetical protein